MNELYEELATAIILQAVEDWRKSVKALKKRPHCTEAMMMKDECEQFFLSEWFGVLTSVDGSMILRKLKQEEGVHED